MGTIKFKFISEFIQVKFLDISVILKIIHLNLVNCAVIIIDNIYEGDCVLRIKPHQG